MGKTRWCVFVSILVVILDLGIGGMEAVSGEGQGYAYIVRSVNQTITGQCSGEVTPDRAVIVGGVTAESLKPGEAKDQIERQLAEIQKYVSERGGTVHVMERVRAVRGAPRDLRHGKTDQLPFVVLQRLEVEFSLAVDIDETLERLLQLGLDQYGRSVRLEHQGSPPQVVVRYRFSDLTEALKSIHQQCKTQAVRNWCAQNTPSEEHATCTQALDTIGHRFVTQSLALQSQPLLGEHGQSAPVHLAYPWNQAQLKAIELVGDVPLSLHGTLTLKLPGGRGW
jgi:hypothetical protein